LVDYGAKVKQKLRSTNQFVGFLLADGVARVRSSTDWNVEDLTAAKYRYHVRLVRSRVTAVSNNETAILQPNQHRMRDHPTFV